MRTLRISTLSWAALVLTALTAAAQQKDSALNRNITVERAFQPVIQSAGKIGVRPATVEAPTLQAATVNYSDETPLLRPDYNVNPLRSQITKFSPGTPFKGHINAAIGHPRTMLDFEYRYQGSKKTWLDIHVNHDAHWGLRTMERTSVNFDFRHQYSGGQFYLNLLGANEFFTRYGRYWNDTAEAHLSAVEPFEPVRRFSHLQEKADYTHVGDKQNLWQFHTMVGVQSDSHSELQYKAEIGYHLMSLTDMLAEHQLRARANISYAFNDHRIGGNIYEQSQFCAIDTNRLDPTTYNSRHGLRIEPFYEYRGRRVNLHIGVNLDVNFGKGQLLSGNENIAFAPSPNILLEAQLAPKWAILYAQATGSFGFSAIPDYVGLNRYADLLRSVQSQHVGAYTPVDAELGFRFRPHRDLLLSVHAGYAWRMNQVSFAAVEWNQEEDPRPYTWDGFQIAYSDFRQWKIGAAAAYHYRDIVDVHLWGDYYIYSGVQNETVLNELGVPVTAGRVYDRPDWEIGLRVDGHIDSHWDVYTYCSFIGARWAMTSLTESQEQAAQEWTLVTPAPSDRRLPATININLGARYHYDKALSFFAEINNLAHQANMIHYGYDNHCTDVIVGVQWKF